MADGPGGLTDRARRFLSHRYLPVLLVIIAVGLSLPGLGLGLQLDDHVLRVGLTRPAPVPAWSKGPVDVFAFFEGAPAANRQFADAGFLPWWAPRDLRLAFSRPLAGLTHWIDFRLWPGHLEVMHLHSLLWFGAVVAASATFFRRFLGGTWVAGLAALLFAVDDGHGLPAVWLANRNASIAACFGILALLAHDGWRKTGSRWSLTLSLAALLLALLGSELGIATAAYLLAYALYLDAGTWRGRVASLVPAAVVCVAWALAYGLLGFGVTGSGMYVAPTDPWRFAAAVVERAPVLMFGQWFLAADMSSLFSPSAARVFWLVACALAGALAVLLAPLLRRDRVARFFGLGMVLSLVPACGTFPSGRLLMLASLGGAGLLAQLLAARVDHAPWLPQGRAWRGFAVAACWAFALLHLVLAPASLAQAAAAVRLLGSAPETLAASLPRDAAVARQTIVVVNTPSFFMSAFGPTLQLFHERPIPGRMLILASGVCALRIDRPADAVLVVRPEGGFLARRGSPAPAGERQPALDVGHMYGVFDTLYRDDTPFRVGDRVELSGVVIEVGAITADGRPAEVAYHFDSTLDDPSRRWLQWRADGYAPFRVPNVGETVLLPAAAVPMPSAWADSSAGPGRSPR